MRILSLKHVQYCLCQGDYGRLNFGIVNNLFTVRQAPRVDGSMILGQIKHA
jgi:hypothetical protein